MDNNITNGNLVNKNQRELMGKLKGTRISFSGNTAQVFKDHASLYWFFHNSSLLRLAKRRESQPKTSEKVLDFAAPKWQNPQSLLMTTNY
jgi:hypothetical protein